MNKHIKLRLWRQRLTLSTKPSLGSQIARLSPELLEPPSNHGDWKGINLGAITALVIALTFIIGWGLIVLIAIAGFPKCSKGATYRIEAGPGQANAMMVLATSSYRIKSPKANNQELPWLHFDPHLATISRDGQHVGVGFDLTVGTPASTPYAEFIIGRTYWFDPTERVEGHEQWHIAGRMIFGTWIIALHHWSNAAQHRQNLGENFVTLGWRW